jgi:hypothetical protein
MNDVFDEVARELERRQRESWGSRIGRGAGEALVVALACGLLLWARAPFVSDLGFWRLFGSAVALRWYVRTLT